VQVGGKAFKCIQVGHQEKVHHVCGPAGKRTHAEQKLSAGESALQRRQVMCRPVWQLANADSRRLLTRVRCHFRLEAKRSEMEAKFCSLRFLKKVFFFRIDAKRRNLKQNGNETKRKQNEKEAKTVIIFASK
jgi:hypothetical protein